MLGGDSSLQSEPVGGAGAVGVGVGVGGSSGVAVTPSPWPTYRPAARAGAAAVSPNNDRSRRHDFGGFRTLLRRIYFLDRLALSTVPDGGVGVWGCCSFSDGATTYSSMRVRFLRDWEITTPGFAEGRQYHRLQISDQDPPIPPGLWDH